MTDKLVAQRIHEQADSITYNITRIQLAIEEKYTNSDNANWGHVGSLGHVREELDELVKFLGA